MQLLLFEGLCSCALMLVPTNLTFTAKRRPEVRVQQTCKSLHEPAVSLKREFAWFQKRAFRCFSKPLGSAETSSHGNAAFSLLF